MYLEKWQNIVWNNIENQLKNILHDITVSGYVYRVYDNHFFLYVFIDFDRIVKIFNIL
jgi:hypothetical protein